MGEESKNNHKFDKTHMTIIRERETKLDNIDQALTLIDVNSSAKPFSQETDDLQKALQFLEKVRNGDDS